MGLGIIGRDIFRQTVGALLLVLVSLTTVVWLATALKQLKLIVSQGQSFWLFLKMTLLVLPNLMALIAPIALLIAAIHTLNRLSGDSELIVINASGATVWRVAAPFLALALIVSSAIAVTNFFVQPYSMRTLRAYVMQVRTDLISQVLQAGQFTSPERNLTFHIRERDKNNDLLGLILHDDRDQTQSISYLAERGRIQSNGDQAVLIMFDGQIQRLNKETRDLKIVTFKSNVFDLSQFRPKTGRYEIKPRERYLSELLHPAPDDKYFKRFPGKFRSELHERIASPLYPIVFVFFVIASLGHARTTRDGWFWQIATCIALCVVARVAGLAATNLTTINAAATPLMYAVPALSIIIAAIAVHVRMSPKLGFKIGLELGQMFKTETRN